MTFHKGMLRAFNYNTSLKNPLQTDMICKVHFDCLDKPTTLTPITTYEKGCDISKGMFVTSKGPTRETRGMVNMISVSFTDFFIQ